MKNSRLKQEKVAEEWEIWNKEKEAKKLILLRFYR